MGDLKINGITPTSIYFGGSDVQKIYNGSELVWPISPLPPGQVEMCNLIWTDVNSSETELTAGGNIVIATNATEWIDAINNVTPIACYWDFDINNASYGLLYNTYAADLIKIPTGFRLPTFTDLSDTGPCVVTAGTYNPIGANPGNWDPAQLTNTTGLGDSGFNVQGYGFLASFGTTVTFDNNGETEFYWKNPTVGTKMYGYGIANGSIFASGYGDAVNLGAFIRFVKDA